ncbi:MAG: alpha/beta fold hydrolase [Anaerolineales bacterium]|nr:alpha/beta fold hydrolase [Anaerolineales bacterium]
MRKHRIRNIFLWILLAFVLLFVSLYLILNVEKLELTDAARENAAGDFIELSGGLVHYQLEGPADSPLIVLVHGFSVPANLWDPTYLALKEAGYQVLRFDLYGRGYSARPDVAYDINLFSTQLEELISELEVDEPVHLVGLSMGGPVVASYANRHPDLVRSITLIAPEVVQVTWKDIFPMNLPGVGEYLMAVYMEPIYLPKWQGSDFSQPENFPDWEERYRVQLQYQGTGRALLSTIRNLVELNAELDYQKLSETKLPVLLIWGSEDQTISEENMQVLQELLPDMQVQIIEKGGHLAHYEFSEIGNPILLEFIDSN